MCCTNECLLHDNSDKSWTEREQAKQPFIIFLGQFYIHPEHKQLNVTCSVTMPNNYDIKESKASGL